MAMSVLHLLIALALAPLLPGIINKVKAAFAGRRGPPVTQLYFDLAKLLRKGVVYSSSVSVWFRLAPIVTLAAVLCAAALTPMAKVAAPLAFTGDFIMIAYLLALARFCAIIGALETASSFEGMGASREAIFSAMAEPAFFLGLAAVTIQTGETSLSAMFVALKWLPQVGVGAALFLVTAALFMVLLTENCRVPVDDPNTHLELTMIHEVMILDYSGPDLAYIEYAAALKLWIMGSVIVAIALPFGAVGYLPALVIYLISMLVLGGLIGVAESIMARLRLMKVTQALVGAAALAGLAILLMVRGNMS